MIDTTNTDQRYIITPAGRGWMIGFDRVDTVTVHFSGTGAGWNGCYKIDECDEVPEYVAPADRRNQRAGHL